MLANAQKIRIERGERETVANITLLVTRTLLRLTRMAHPTVWHSAAASALHGITSKKLGSRARSGQLECRVGPTR